MYVCILTNNAHDEPNTHSLAEVLILTYTVLEMAINTVVKNISVV